MNDAVERWRTLAGSLEHQQQEAERLLSELNDSQGLQALQLLADGARQQLQAELCQEEQPQQQAAEQAAAAAVAPLQQRARAAHDAVLHAHVAACGVLQYLQSSSSRWREGQLQLRRAANAAAADAAASAGDHAKLRVFCSKRRAFEQRVTQQRLMELYRQPVVAEHFSELLVMSYGRDCSSLRCDRCNAREPAARVRHHLLLHVCALASCGAKQLSEQQLVGARLLQHGRCVLCEGAVNEGEPHACSSSFWRTLVIDQSALPHASPVHAAAVVLRQARLRRLRDDFCLPVAVVIRVPPAWLPRRLRSQQQQQHMLAAGSWPLVRFVAFTGPSETVSGQRGLYSMLPLDHSGTAAAGLAAQLGAVEAALAAGTPQPPLLQRAIVGAYTGVRLQGTAADLPSEPAGHVGLLSVSPNLHYAPGCLGGVLFLANLGHGPAASIDCGQVAYNLARARSQQARRKLPSPSLERAQTRSRSSKAPARQPPQPQPQPQQQQQQQQQQPSQAARSPSPQPQASQVCEPLPILTARVMLGEPATAAAGEAWGTDADGEVFLATAAGGVELLWDYAARSCSSGDELASEPCCCWGCACGFVEQQRVVRAA